MADITLNNITPRYFFEAVKLLKETEHRIYITHNSLEVRFKIPNYEPILNVNKRFDELECFMYFLQELQRSNVPTDLEKFIEEYRYKPRRKYFVK